jgi:hypothetical protein
MLSSKSTALPGRGFGVALGYAVPRLVTEEANDGSGPVEAILESSPVGPLLRATPGPHTKSILRPSSFPQNCINSLKVGGFLFIDLTHVCAITVIRPVDAGDMKTPLWMGLLIIEDALNFLWPP